MFWPGRVESVYCAMSKMLAPVGARRAASVYELKQLCVRKNARLGRTDRSTRASSSMKVLRRAIQIVAAPSTTSTDTTAGQYSR